MKELMRKAHQLTKEIKAEFPEVNYSAQLGLCITYLMKEGNEMKELKGSEKQVAWAEKIRTEQLNSLEFKAREFEERALVAKISVKPLSIAKQIRESMEEIKNEESAKWWIDNRNISASTVDKITGLGRR